MIQALYSPDPSERTCHFLSASESRGFGGRGGFWNATDPTDLGLIVALHLGLTVSPTVKDHDPLLLLFWALFAQLLHHLFDRSA